MFFGHLFFFNQFIGRVLVLSFSQLWQTVFYDDLCVFLLCLIYNEPLMCWFFGGWSTILYYFKYFILYYTIILYYIIMTILYCDFCNTPNVKFQTWVYKIILINQFHQKTINYPPKSWQLTPTKLYINLMNWQRNRLNLSWF